MIMIKYVLISFYVKKKFNVYLKTLNKEGKPVCPFFPPTR